MNYSDTVSRLRNTIVNGDLTVNTGIISTPSLLVNGNQITGDNVISVGTLSNLIIPGNINAGNVNATLLTGYLATSSQPNITSVGTLTGLTVSGPVTLQSGEIVTGNITTGNLNTSGLITGTLATSSQPNITSVGTLTNLNVSGLISTADTTINRISETINNYGSISFDIITTTWILGNLIYATPTSSNNISLVITSVPTTINSTFNFSVILDASSYKVYVNSLTINGSNTTLLYNGGPTSIPILTSATVIIQTFNAINTNTGIWKVITSINIFY